MATGARRAVQIHEGVIRSRARLTYGQVAAWLEHGDADAVEDTEVRAMLGDTARLFAMLEKGRRKRGALDLDLPEVRAVLHDNTVSALDVQERLVSHRLIEEMMLAANTAVAEYFEERQVPLLYRIHPAPKPESIQTLNDFLAPFGLSLPNKPNRPLKPAEVERILARASDTPVAHVLHRLILRSMQQARYTPDNDGHFGLAYHSYCHFTSPIRRYADLCVHRRLKAMLRSEPPDAVLPHQRHRLLVAEHAPDRGGAPVCELLCRGAPRRDHRGVFFLRPPRPPHRHSDGNRNGRKAARRGDDRALHKDARGVGVEPVPPDEEGGRRIERQSGERYPWLT